MTSLLVLRGEDPPPEATVVIRGGEHGLDDENLRRTAQRSFTDLGFYGVSVFVAVDQPVEILCAEVDAIRRYGRVRFSTVASLHQAGFALLATGGRPHFDIALPDLAGPTLSRLRDCFGPAVPNPGRR